MDYVIKPTDDHFDLITATRAMLRKCPVTWIPHHVKGHQDDDPNATLDLWALLNIEMDDQAKLHWAETATLPRTIQHTISGEPWTLWHKDQNICVKLKAKIHTTTRGQACLDYWTKRGKFGQGTYSDVDWVATGQAMKKVSIPRRQWVSKHTSGFCGTSKMMLLWRQRATDLCPGCLTVQEDATHVWQCQDQVWKKAIGALKLWLLEQQTEPGIIRVLCAKLLAWQSGSTEQIPIGTFEGLPAVVQRQDEIGWQSLLEGRPALGWSEAQQRYFEGLGSRRTGLRWLTALIQKLWDIAWDMWDHRNRVLHETEHSVAHELQTQQITDQFLLGAAGLPRKARALFSKGLQHLLRQQPAYKTAWLIRIHAARARTERRNVQHNDNYNLERDVMRRWLQVPTNN
jgi:hypothetical protein